MKTRILASLALVLVLAVPASAQQFFTGNLSTTGDVVTALVPGNTRTVEVQITGLTGTVTFTHSVDGVNYVTVTATNASGLATGTTATSSGIYVLPASPFLRVTATSISGTVPVVFSQSGTGGASGGGSGTLTCAGSGASPCIVAGGGTAGSAATGVVTVQGIASMTPVIVTGAFAESAAATNADRVVPMGAVVNSSLASRAADGQYSWLATDVTGTLFTNGTLAADGVAASTNRHGTLPAITETGTLPTLTDGRNAALYVNTNGILFTGGAFGSNGVAATTNRVPTLPAIAVSSNPSNTNGRDSALYTNLTGGLLTQLQQPDGTAVTLANDPCGSTTKTQAIIDNAAASGNAEIVALSGSTVIYVCSIDVTAEATVDFQLISGTGSACGTNETNLTGLYAFSTTTGLLGINKGSGGYYVYKTTAGHALCVETSAGVQLNGSVTYVQQ